VKRPTIPNWSHWWTYCVAALAGQMRAPDLPAYPATHSLELPLTPLPALRTATWLLLAVLTLQALHLLWFAQWRALAVLLPVALLSCLQLAAARRPALPRRMLWTAAGRVYLCQGGRPPREVVIGGDSTWLGPAVLLVLKSPGRCQSLLLGPGNLDPVTLAALRRRLRAAAAAATALHSRFAHRTDNGSR
jgi:hypothetical protein